MNAIAQRMLALCDEQVTHWTFGKTYRPEVKERLQLIQIELEGLRAQYPASWRHLCRYLGRQP